MSDDDVNDDKIDVDDLLDALQWCRAADQECREHMHGHYVATYYSDQVWKSRDFLAAALREIIDERVRKILAEPEARP